MKRNSFSKALKHLKSTKLDEKLQRLNETPTNSMGGVYALNDPGFRVGIPDPPKVYYPDIDGNWPDGIPGEEGALTYTRPAGYWSGGSDWDSQTSTDFSQNYLLDDPTGKSTSGLIAEDGTVLAKLPPDSQSFILGPIVDGFVLNHITDAFTNIGYIQKDTRQFVLLGRIAGQWKSDIYSSSSNVPVWGGTSTGFTSYNENFTLAMAQWVRDEILADRYATNVPYFYSGGVPQTPQSPASCPNCPPGMYGGSAVGGSPFGSGGNPSIGSQQGAPTAGGPNDAGWPSWGFPGFPPLGPLLNALQGLGQGIANAVAGALNASQNMFNEIATFFEDPIQSIEKAAETLGEELSDKVELSNDVLDNILNAIDPNKPEYYGPAFDNDQKADQERYNTQKPTPESEPFNLGTNFTGGPIPRTPQSPQSYGPAFSNNTQANVERDSYIRNLSDNSVGDPRQDKAVTDWNNAIHQAGGGKSAETQKNLTRAEVIQQGRENLGLPRTQYFPKDFKHDYEYNYYKMGGGDAALKDGKTKKDIQVQGQINSRMDGHWMNPNTWSKDPIEGLKSLIDDAMMVGPGAGSNSLKFVQSVNALKAAQAIYGAKTTAQAINNIKGPFTAAKGKGAPRPPQFSDKGREVWNTQLGKYETVTPKDGLRWDWSQRTLNDDLFKHYTQTGEMPSGLDGWNVTKAFTPQMMKTGPTPGAAAGLAGLGAVGVELGAPRAAQGQVAGSSSNKITPKEKAAAQSVEKPDGTTDFNKLDNLFNTDPEAFSNAIQGILKNSDEREKTQFSDVEPQTPPGGTLDAKTSAKVDQLIKQGKNTKPGSSASDYNNKQLINLLDKIPSSDPRYNQILRQISGSGFRPVKESLNLKKVKFVLREQESPISNTPEQPPTLPDPSPLGYRGQGMTTGEQPTDYSSERLAWFQKLNSNGRDGFISGYISGTIKHEGMEGLEKMFKGTTVSSQTVNALSSDITRYSDLSKEYTDKAMQIWGEISPKITILLDRINTLLANWSNSYIGLAQSYFEEIDVLYVPYDAYMEASFQAADAWSASVTRMGSYIRNGKLMPRDPFYINDPTVAAELRKRERDKEIDRQIKELESENEVLKTQQQWRGVKMMVMIGFDVATAISLINVLTGPADEVAVVGAKTAVQQALDDIAVSAAQKQANKTAWKQWYGRIQSKGGRSGRWDGWEGPPPEVPYVKPFANSYELEGQVLTESRKKILREVKKPYKLPEQQKQKYRMNFKGKFRPQNTPDVTASKQTEESVKAQNAAGQTWRTSDRYWKGYETVERMNILYDNIGHGSQYWDRIVNENQNRKGWRDREVQEQLNMIAHEKAMIRENPQYESPFQKQLEEQETMRYDNDPLFKRVSKKLRKEIDYSKKPSRLGYPDNPPPMQKGGWHPEYGNRDAYYNKLDPHSAEAMPSTGNEKIDAAVEKAKKQPKKGVPAKANPPKGS